MKRIFNKAYWLWRFVRRLEPIRFLWHVGFISVLACYKASVSAQIFLVTMLFLALILTFFELHAKRKVSLFKKLLREKEIASRTAAVDFVIGCIATCILAPHFVVPILLATAWCDPCARVFGKYMHGKKIPGIDKSYWGAFACFVVALTVLVLFFSWKVALFLAVIAMFAEACDPRNLTKRWWWLQDNGRIQVALAISLLVVG